MANEKRLIDANALMFKVNNSTASKAVKAVCAVFICSAPTVDAVEVKHGRWVDKMVRDWHCSVCGKKVPRQVWFDGYCYNDKLNYCPNCGAHMMDGDGNG